MITLLNLIAKQKNGICLKKLNKTYSVQNKANEHNTHFSIKGDPNARNTRKFKGHVLSAAVQSKTQ
jgi:hypothetical protein